MEFCYRSSILVDEKKEMSFKKDMIFSEMQEEEWRLDSSVVEGFVRSIRLNRLFILHQDYKSNTEVSLFLKVDEPVFKLHFEFEGAVVCNFLNEKHTPIKVSKGMFNLFYLPLSTREYKNTSKHKNSLEIFFTESYLQNTLGFCFTGNSLRLKESKLNNTPCLFYNDGMFLNSQIGIIAKDIMQCNFKGAMKKAFLEAKVTELILFSLTVNSIKKNKIDVHKDDSESLKLVEKHIKENLKQELTIAELSLLAGFNTSKFKKCFKDFYGTTVFKFITLQRVEKAKELIEKKRYSISQASYEVGYKNPQHFTVAFKRVFGYLPSQIGKME